MTEEEAAPKHPYVTAANAKFHLIMSIIAAVLSTIQVGYLEFGGVWRSLELSAFVLFSFVQPLFF